MADRIETVREVEDPAVERSAGTTRTREITEVEPSGMTMAARVVWYIAGVLLALLAFRFVLALLGANPNNGFANFIYTVSHPFVAPFFSLFGYNLHYGVSHFESYTLVGILVYAVIAWGITRLLTIGQPHQHHMA
ncbi:MAG TPA: YggT family protein [Verrucomicrobiae bacterium]|nr:YggT family protein [Verrucomicrobiae bacterium]